jgi:hypothetical protein
MMVDTKTKRVADDSDFNRIDRRSYVPVEDYHARVAARPKVQQALKAEGLVK